MIGKKHLMAAAFALLAVTALPSAAKADSWHISFGSEGSHHYVYLNPPVQEQEVVYAAPPPVVQQRVEYVPAYPQPYYYPVYYYQPAPSFGWHHHDHDDWHHDDHHDHDHHDRD